MSRTLARTAVLVATAISAVALSTGTASASTCNDAVVRGLHLVHDVAGDPTGLAHGAEEVWCQARP